MLSFLSLLQERGKRPPSLQETSDHFSHFSQKWWDENGPFAILHQLNPLRLCWIKEQASLHFNRLFSDPRMLKGLRILDIGSGGGLVTEPLARLGADVTGLDLVPENIACAKAHALAHDLSISYFSAPLHSFLETEEAQEKFDMVIGFEVVEHVNQPGEFIQQAASLLKQDGLLLLSTLNRTFRSYLLGIIAAEYILKWVPKGTHRWSAFITPGDLRWYLARAGLESGSFQGLSFSPLLREWSLTSDTQVNYFASARKTGKVDIL